MIDTLKAAFPEWAFAPNVMITARVSGWNGDITAHIDHYCDYTARVEQGARVVYGRGATAPEALADALREVACG